MHLIFRGCDTNHKNSPHCKKSPDTDYKYPETHTHLQLVRRLWLIVKLINIVSPHNRAWLTLCFSVIKELFGVYLN